MQFKDIALQRFWADPSPATSRSFPADLIKVIYRKLQMLDAANTIQDLRIPPSNHLEKLTGDRKGQYSIRVNKQYRLCFIWNGFEALEVEFVDYH